MANNDKKFKTEPARQQNQQASDWQKMLQMMTMTQKMDPTTMAGFGLGRLIRQAWLNYKDKKEWNRTHALSKDSQKQAQQMIDSSSGMAMPSSSAAVSLDNYAASLPGVDNMYTSGDVTIPVQPVPAATQAPQASGLNAYAQGLIDEANKAQLNDYLANLYNTGLK